MSSEGFQGWAVLRVAGEIDLVTGGQIRAEVHRMVAEGRRRVVLDLAAVRFCDSSGVGVLIAARRLLRSCSGELRLVLPPSAPAVAPPPSGPHGAGGGHVHRVFTALGIRRLFDIYPDVPSAVAPPLARPA
ncbi:STAS domain-containing protein [Streptacidiphilus sp. PB12-B1b]|uniref:STAS domain-containing protein n=1 Tax=Streptacidiphilus sp. PB12-B1b TaxID=2705012 RepID=UPI0015FB332C|nr:STAS domain-containing protein [Streptacidiphilus sp. PB12-B1b]QMU79996.1 STAS domain-containing protein [Streptacidiphilus sp. PB12-B1b]